MKERATAYFGELQTRICSALEVYEGKYGPRFREDRWEGGVTRVLDDAPVFEKAGVSLADVVGRLSPRIAERMGVEPQEFLATGISLVLHPRSPMVPTVHMNLRFISLTGDDVPKDRPRAWFGGGVDLTPYYLFEDDARHFHGKLRAVCRRHDPEFYSRFKKWCDEYFRIPHRNEARGIGGIFFDYLAADDAAFSFVRDVGNVFLDAYEPIVDRRKDAPWYDRERDWQLVRRGRYTEFNLVYDRGTLFGLETGGRTESILMSLPPMARWRYDHRPRPQSREAELLEVLREPREWLRESPAVEAS